MAMKKIKPQYGKVVPPVVPTAVAEEPEPQEVKAEETPAVSEPESPKTKTEKIRATTSKTPKNSGSKITAIPNPFMQTKEIFAKTNLTKIGYRMRTEYVEILDIIKKMKKGGYTLEAVLDDALTHYFENSEDGREALRKAEIFYS